MDSFIREYGWFLAFWSTLILIGTVEYLAPQLSGKTDRKRRWPINLGLSVLNGLIASSLPVVTVASAQWASEREFGLLHWIAAPWWIAVIVTLLARSFGQYAFHVATHKIPLLWRLHRVHHCDDHLDATSALRVHPIEVVASAAAVVPIIVLCGLPPVVLAVFEAFEGIFTLITHANIRVPGPVDRLLRILFVTPYLHRIHHSPEQIETDSNYANVFTIWDRLFGTYRGVAIQSGDDVRFGLDDISQERAGDFHYQLSLPWR
jgi:sterol desaturase/sphingolipid hydroxylase (fatty acid hydroxylase superfamily)